MDLIFTSLLGALIGVIIAILSYRLKTISGVLKIDHSNPEKDVYRFEIDKIEDLDKMSEIVLTIDHNANLSQE